MNIAQEKLIRRLTGKAIAEYRMIEEGDRILVGVSGGKDSLVLLWILHKLQRRAPVGFNLVAVTLDQGYATDYAPVEEYCRSLSLPYYIRQANLAKIVFEARMEDNPCALCSHLRRGALVRIARELDCNKLAYAHHADDAVETLLLNLFFTGQIASFLPVTDLSRQQIRVIRPLVYVREHLIKKLADDLNLPVVPNPCPAARRTRRQQVKEILAELETVIPGLHQRLLSALRKKDVQLWPAADQQP